MAIDKIELKKRDTITEEIKREQGKIKILNGFSDTVANSDSIWKTVINSNIEEGQLVFAYRNTEAISKTNLYQIVVVKNLDIAGKVKHNSYSIYLATTDYSLSLSNVNEEYLKCEIYDKLVLYKVDSEILSSFLKSIE